MSIDLYWNNVVLMCHCDGDNDSTTFIEETGKTLAAKGNAKISTAQSKFGGSSAYFDGTGDYLSIFDNSEFNFGTNDLTIEGWIYTISGGGTPLINCQNGSNLISFYLDTSTSARLILSNVNVINPIVLQANVWQHIAIVRNGLNWKVYVNGTQAGTYTLGANTAYNCSANCYIGGYAGGHYYNGYVDEIRYTVGVARYTSNFTPDTEAFYSRKKYMKDVVLLCRYNEQISEEAFIDETGKTVTVNGTAELSGLQSKFGCSSAYFDGTGDYLEIINSSIFYFGSNDFTIEFWYYPVAFANYTTFFIQRLINDGSSIVPIYFCAMANGTLGLWCSSNLISWNLVNGVFTSQALSLNQWTHVALVRYNNNISIYLNGVNRSSNSISGSLAQSSYNLLIGANYHGSINGYLDEYRITKGIARYTSDFTPPNLSFPFTSDPYKSNVSLLLTCSGANNSQTFIDKANNKVTVYGNTKISTDQFKFYGNSTYFNNSNDYLSLNHSTDWDFGNQNFSVELWIYATATISSKQHLIRTLEHQRFFIISIICRF